jgi:hypothetical protein
MKKIGILTLPLSDNYGGIIQAVALYGYLEEKGFDVFLIRKEIYRPLPKRALITLLELIPLQNFKNIRSRAKKTKIHRAFIDNHIKNMTRSVSTTAELKSMALKENFDAIIVGSDQVWRMDCINDGFYKSYFLDFLEDEKTKKISYAASFGKDHWQAPDKIVEVTDLLSKFHAISTREINGVEICRDTFSRDDCKHVLDPTLLVAKDFYRKFQTSTEENSGKKTLLTYILDKSEFKTKLCASTINSLGDEYSISHLLNQDSPGKTYSIPEWIRAFGDASYVITDSFHGMVFSIIFNKEFTVIINKERGASRFHSLLKLLGLESRIIESQTNADLVKPPTETIDYARVNKTLQNMRISSRDFLIHSILD